MFSETKQSYNEFKKKKSKKGYTLVASIDKKNPSYLQPQTFTFHLFFFFEKERKEFQID